MAIDKITLQATDNLFVNTEITGTEAAKMPVGTTAERANVQAGDIRFNSTTSLMEYYDGVQWKSIDSPPAVTSISPSNIADSDSSVDITINGLNFISGGQVVTAVGSDGSTITAGTVTRVSNTELTANFDGTSFDNAQEPYDIKVENSNSGLSIVGSDLLNVNASPAWTVSAGSLGSIYDSLRTGVSFTTGATDSEGASLTYSVSVGSLPAGLSIDSATGTISGNATAVGSDTTSTFTLSVTDGTNTVTRQYSITVNAPAITSYTSTGSGTFSVPSGITAVDVLVVAGGGGGASAFYGGGAGGLIYRPAFPVTPGGSISYTVGAGGAGGNWPQNDGSTGQDSTFGTLTSKGGGLGRKQVGSGGYTGGPGGSGGGGSSHHGGSVVSAGGTGIQPQQPGESSTYGFGNPGGSSDYGSGGGGGAGAAGGNANNYQGGNGGIGKQYDISGTQTYYAGGGGGSSDANGSPRNAGTGGQGGGGTSDAPSYPQQNGAANRGGGGGGAYYPAPNLQDGGDGGSGIIIVKY
jgi:hypothetical protein